jgi:uncharacterized membrane protein YphA (DoxX/SURF4 family)
MTTTTVILIGLTLCRVITGALLLIAGAAKLKAGPIQFNRAILGYGIVSPSDARLLGKVLPILEIGTGVCLIVGLFVPAACVVAFGLLLMFSWAMMNSLYRGRKHDCGCFGVTQAKQVRWQMVYRNLALMGIVVIVFTTSDQTFALDRFLTHTFFSRTSLSVLALLASMWIFQLAGTLTLSIVTRRRMGKYRAALT